jgi:hypothetical protein
VLLSKGAKELRKKGLEESAFIRVIYGEAEASGMEIREWYSGYSLRLVCALSERRRFKTVLCG